MIKEQEMFTSQTVIIKYQRCTIHFRSCRWREQSYVVQLLLDVTPPPLATAARSVKTGEEIDLSTTPVPKCL
jgi:hypothetical protein